MIDRAPAAAAAPPRRLRLRVLLDGLYLATGYLAALAVALVFLMMIGAALFRMLGLPTRGTNDIVAWLSAAGAFLGMAHTFVHGDLVRVGILVEKLPGRWRHGAECGALALCTAFAAWMAYWAIAGTVESYRFEQLAEGLIPMPMWIPQSAFVAGATVFCIAVADQLVQVLRGAEPAYETALKARRAQNDFSSEV